RPRRSERHRSASSGPCLQVGEVVIGDGEHEIALLATVAVLEVVLEGHHGIGKGGEPRLPQRGFAGADVGADKIMAAAGEGLELARPNQGGGAAMTIVLLD